ncbi:MAG: ABC transporter substrate-binding protein [Bacillota bacterium]|nr:ABC transporter substrate-binding protein [Bacillota bacterium]
MRRTVFKVLAVITAMVLVLSLAACGSSSTGTSSSNSVSAASSSSSTPAASTTAKQSGFTIGFANGYIGNTWRSQFVDDFQKAAQKYKDAGIIKDFQVVSCNADVTQQLNQINTLISSGVDALMIDPVSATSLGPVIAKAKAQGILVIITNDPAAYDGTYAVIGNNDAFWRIQTTWMAEQLKGKGNIVEITGLPGNTADTLRVNAAKDVLSKYPGIKVLASAPGKWSETEAQSVMSTFINTYKNFDGILEQDVMAEGVLRAYETAGKKPPVMTGDYTFGFLNKWAQTPDLNTIGVPYAPGMSADVLGITIRLLQGKQLKDGVMQANPLNPSLKNAIMLDPPYVVTKDGDPNAVWMKGYSLTKAIKLDDAAKLGQGQPSTAALDATLTDDQLNSFFK